MKDSKLLDPIQILKGSDHSIIKDAALIHRGQIIAFGEKAREEGKQLNLKPTPVPHQLLAPCLVDPHSILEEPISGRSESLKSLLQAAANSGYGQIALLPRSSSWRDAPEKLKKISNSNFETSIHFWGSFSKGGNGLELAPHGEQIKCGAIGIAEDDGMIPTTLLHRGLATGEIGTAPLLIAPRDPSIQGDGMVREGVETLRAGWVPDPITSETIPLRSILELQNSFPKSLLTIMNISTSEGVEILRSASSPKPLASVSWWHLVADRTTLNPIELGWRVTPSLGGAKDRQALKEALKDRILTGVAVNSVPLDQEDTQLPPDQCIPGISGHHLVLPSLWKELVEIEGWSAEELWQALSFGPSKLLKIPEEKLKIGSSRWLIFDPEKFWTQQKDNDLSPNAANQPWEGEKIKGKVVASGLTNQVDQDD